MRDIETLKKHSKYKLIVMYLASILLIILISLLQTFIKEENSTWFIVSRYISFILVEIGFINKIIKYHFILSKNGYAEKEIIKINDERLIYIRLKALNIAFKFVIFINAIMWIIFSFVNEFIYYFLTIELLIMVVAYFSTKIYFNKKY